MTQEETERLQKLEREVENLKQTVRGAGVVIRYLFSKDAFETAIHMAEQAQMSALGHPERQAEAKRLSEQADKFEADLNAAAAALGALQAELSQTMAGKKA